MSMRYYSVCAQGAIFYADDYDPIKVVMAIAQEDIGGLPAEINVKLESGVFDKDTADKICRLLDIPCNPNVSDYSFISKNFVEDLSEWSTDGLGKIEDDILECCYFTDLEAEFRYASEGIKDERLDSCLMLTLHSPFVWDIAEYTGPKSKQEVIGLIRKAVKALLKDDIDWERRLGELVGTTFG